MNSAAATAAVPSAQAAAPRSLTPPALPASPAPRPPDARAPRRPAAVAAPGIEVLPTGIAPPFLVPPPRGYLPRAPDRTRSMSLNQFLTTLVIR